MSIFSFLLFFTLISDGGSSSNLRNSSILPPPPHFLVDHPRNSTLDEFLGPDSVDYHRQFLWVREIPGEEILRSPFVDPVANFEIVSDGALNNVPDPPRLGLFSSFFHWVELIWNPPADDGGSEITGYKIEWSTDDGSKWKVLEEDYSIGMQYSFRSSRLTPGSSFQFRVRAINENGDSAPSNVLTVTAKSSTGRGIPTNVTATQSSSDAIKISWTAPADLMDGASVADYWLFRSEDNGDFWTPLVFSLASTKLTYIDNSLIVGTTYGYRLYARIRRSDAIVETRTFSSSAFVTLAAAPNAPTSLTAAASGQTIIDLSWIAPSNDGGAAITGYRIEVSTDGGSSFTNLESNTGLSADTTRHYQVRAINSVGPGVASNIANATTDAIVTAAPGPPTSLTAAADGPTRITLSWTAPTNNGGAAITGYRIEVSTDGGIRFTNLVTNHRTTSYAHTGLSARSTRHYQVRAINRVGPGVASNIANATTAAATAPGAPTLLTAAADGQTKINLSWIAPSNAGGADITGYQVEVSTDGGTRFTNLVTNHTTTSYAHTGLSAATTRHYRVRAINSVGTSVPSNIANATTAASVVSVEASFDAASSQVSESAGTITVQINLNPAPISSLTLPYTLTGSATQNIDYTIQGSGSVDATSSSATISIDITDDQDEELNDP